MVYLVKSKMEGVYPIIHDPISFEPNQQCIHSLPQGGYVTVQSLLTNGVASLIIVGDNF